MKAPIFIVLLTYATSLPVAGQHPLVGTWEMISAKGIGAEGDPFFLDTTAARETKIITPTHYMLIAWDVEDDSLIFNRTMAGMVRLEGTKYIETPTQASVQLFEDLKVDFEWKLEGDIFTQSGTIIRPDGKSVILEALVFQRVRDIKPRGDNPTLGTWKQLSGYYKSRDGKVHTTFNPSDTRLLIFTPTHWMRMDHRDKEFGGVLYGTYRLEDDSISMKPDYSSYPFKEGDESRFSKKISDSRIEFTWSGKTPDGKVVTYYEVFEKL